MGTMALKARQADGEGVREKESVRRALGRRLYSDKIAHPAGGARIDASSASGEGAHAPCGVGVSLPSICPVTAPPNAVRPPRAGRINQDVPVFIKLVPVKSRSASCRWIQGPKASRALIRHRSGWCPGASGVSRATVVRGPQRRFPASSRFNAQTANHDGNLHLYCNSVFHCL